METFEEWKADHWNKKGIDHDTFNKFLMREAKQAWNHQQQKIEKLEADKAKLIECVRFYTHEKARGVYTQDSVMRGHSYDMACSACSEKNKGKRARQCLKDLGIGDKE